MDETLFYVFGITLVLSALATAFMGLRFEGFPPTRLAVAAVIGYFACLVGATTTFAVLNARDQAHKREAEQAAATTTPAAGATTTAQGTTAPSGAAQGEQQAATTLKLAAESNAIAYDTKQLSAKAGRVTIDFNNPSALTHDVCLEDSSGSQVGCSDTIMQSSTSLSEDLQAGTYTFYCSVDAHRQAGMEGTLTVK